ncbi:MAG: ShlB/FhaC/HecB family hemolysin secretion/activation protein [Candidatus Gastranaerophilales bacterium]|nr:ShlB/FhaC/HecB family hemolysin secretion/activation protein [Candidatus Gastranaerophilales bacterium]
MKKKQVFCLACILFSLSLNKAMSEPLLVNPTAGAEIINRENRTILKDAKINKNYIDSVEKEIPQQIEDRNKDKSKDIVRGNLTYNPKFTLNSINFEGNTKISDKKLQKLANNIIGKEIYLEDVLNFTLSVSRYYQQNGYLTSYAYLDAQEIKDGSVTIKIKESKIEKKEIEGNRWERENYLKNIALGGTGLNEGSVFNAKALQGAMKNINREDYLTGSAELSKTKDEGTAIKLHVQDRFPINVNMGWDDFGRNYTGRQRFTATAGMDNLTGNGDKIYAGSIVSSRSNGFLAGYELPVGKWGTKVGVDYSYSRVHLGGPYKGYNIDGEAQDFVVRLVQPLKNTATQEVYFTAAFDMLNSKSLMQKQTIADYNLRVIRTAFSGMFDDKYGRYIGSVGADFGIGGLGATGNINEGQQSTFYKITANSARVQRLPKNCLGIFRMNGQYSPQSLYAAEQFYLGGVYSLRGYQPSELIGDYGVSGSLEFRAPIPHLDALIPKKFEQYADRIRITAFYDWGYIKEHNNVYDYPQNFLSSIGIGAYANLWDGLTAQIGVGFPIGKYYEEQNGRVYFSINSDIDRLLMKPKERL